MANWRAIMKLTALAVLVVVAVALLLPSRRASASEGWLSDFDGAKKAATAANKPILADFTGSDWCIWCKRLDAEVFSQDVFKSFARENVVLFVADFPQERELDEATANQNRRLAEQYGVQGFPTVLLLDAGGKVLARTGYRRGGADAYVAHLRELVASARGAQRAEETAEKP
jgi:thiol:disulfide interchange protein